MEEFILKVIEVVGINAVPFMLMTWLYLKQQNIQKTNDAARATIETTRIEMERESRKAETMQQNNILNMYNRFDGTLSRFDRTLQSVFTTNNEVSVKVVTALEANTAKLVDLETVMIDHTKETPTIADLILSIEALGEKIDNVDTNVKQIKDEFDVLKTQAETVKKTTQETPVVSPPDTPKATSTTPAQRQHNPSTTSVPPIVEQQESIDKKTDNPSRKEQ